MNMAPVMVRSKSLLHWQIHTMALAEEQDLVCLLILPNSDNPKRNPISLFKGHFCWKTSAWLISFYRLHGRKHNLLRWSQTEKGRCFQNSKHIYLLSIFWQSSCQGAIICQAHCQGFNWYMHNYMLCHREEFEQSVCSLINGTARRLFHQ